MKNARVFLLLLLQICILVVQGCKKNSDTNIIEKEFSVDNIHFVGSRTLDKLCNVYTKEIVNGMFSNDTVRHYQLSTWTTIEYWDGDGGYFLFKNYNLADNNGLRVASNQISTVNDNYLKSTDDKKKENIKEKFNRDHFDVLTANEQVIWDYVQGDWHGWDHPLHGYDVYYKLHISGRHLEVKSYAYIDGQSDRYSNWDNAPFTSLLNCNFSGAIERQTTPTILEISSTSEVKQEEGRAYLLLSSECQGELKLYLGNPAQTYKDAKKDLDVSLKAQTVGWNASFTRGANFSN